MTPAESRVRTNQPYAEVCAVAEAEGTPLTDAVLLTGGRAARTYRVRRHGDGGPQDAILRMENETGPTSGVALSTRAHFELLDSLAAHDVSSPRPLGTGRVTTGEYLLTRLLPGDVPSPWSRRGRDALRDEPLRSRLPAACARMLTAIHQIPTSSLRGVASVLEVRPADELDRWRTVLESTAFGADPLIRWCLYLVERDLPPAVPAALVHGDFRLGNLVVRDGSLSGVLDWELATVGDPVLDLGLLCAPPVAADWARCGLEPIDRLVDRYLDGRPDAAELQARLPAVTVLATIKVIALWVNGARTSGSTVTMDAARCGLNALDSRRYLAECLRPGSGGIGAGSPPGAGAATARVRWRSEVDRVLSEAKEQAQWEDAVLPVDLVDPPPPERARAAALLNDVIRVAADLGLATSTLEDPVPALADLVRDYQATGRPSPAVDRVVEELVLRTVEPELAPRPW